MVKWAASTNFTQASIFSSALRGFAVHSNVMMWTLQKSWIRLADWSQEPVVFGCLTTWVTTFTVVVVVTLGLGFGPRGVVAGSSAAAFQAWMYGGFTPAAGLFATLTSLGMLGILRPSIAIFAAIVASAVAMMVYRTSI